MTVIKTDRLVLRQGDCLDIMRKRLSDNSIDAIVCDPPYGLGFMGKNWDALPPGIEWAKECYRVLKPGGHILAFGGTRTWHRLAVAIEDGGFELRDSIAWLYGSGFPKGLDIAKAIDKDAGHWRGRAGSIVSENSSMSAGNYERTEKGEPITAQAQAQAQAWAGWNTSLKPAFEPIVVGRKAISESTVAANVLMHGTGAFNVAACRIGDEIRVNPAGSTNPRVAMGDGWRADAEPTIATGRWPANVVLDEAMAAVLDEQAPNTGTNGQSVHPAEGKTQADVFGTFGREARAGDKRDKSGASRFFYVAKAPAKERPKVDGVAHPTVKPLALMRWLCKLVTPPDGLILDPFLGSGTTAQAALAEGFRCYGIEREESYFALIKQRLGLDEPAVD